MYLVAIAWIYVVLMMAAAEATAPNGTVVGAVFTVLLYGVMPLSIVMYVMATPQRRRMRRAREAAEAARLDGGEPPPAADSALAPDGSHHATGEPVAPERKEP